MIRGIGIDSVEIARFAEWRTFNDSQLQKIFSEPEIIYCREQPIKSAERFAVRYAAREAFFKALSAMELENHVPFLMVCKLVHVCRNEQGVCNMEVDWSKILQSNNKANFRTHLSMTHDQSHAVAFVIVEELG